MDDDLRDIATLAQLVEWAESPAALPPAVRTALRTDAAELAADLAARHPGHRFAVED